MANVYVRSGAAGAGTGADWTNAYTRLDTALNAKAAGDDFWVSEDHSETVGSAVTLTSPGTAAAPCRIICALHTGTSPPVAADLRTTALVANTTAANINMTGYAYCYGVTFQNGASNAAIAIGTTANMRWHFNTCGFTAGNNASASVQIGGASAVSYDVIWEGCTYTGGNVGNTLILQGGRFRWKGGSVAGTVPTVLFKATSRSIRAEIEGVDFSAMTSGKTIVGDLAVNSKLIMKDCKFGGSVTPTTALTVPGSEVEIIRSNSTGLTYDHSRLEYTGSTVTEATVVRTGGASDGGTTFSWLMTPTANCKRFLPLVSPPFSIYNTSTSSTTVTVYGIWGGGAVPTTADLWLEAEYPSDAATGASAFITNEPATILTAGGNHTSDSSTWGGSTTKFKMALTFTPAKIGPIQLRVFVGTTSAVYIDPKPEISGVTVGKSFMTSPGVLANELSSASSGSARVIGG